MVTSKLPVVPGSSLGTTVIWSPNSPSRVSFSALKYFPYPHPPQYWMETVQWSDMVDVAVERGRLGEVEGGTGWRLPAPPLGAT